MGLGVGSIVSVGGGGGVGGSGGGSGIQELNGQTGPAIDLVGVSGIAVVPVSANQINIGFNRFAESFTSITSGTFSHNFNNLDVIVQVYDDNRHLMLPDSIVIENGDQVSLTFNRPQSGRIIII